MATPKAVGARLDEALLSVRKSFGLHQDDMAKLLGIARRTLVRWEQGEAEPTGRRLDRLLRALHRRDVRAAERVATAAKSTLEAHGLAPAPTTVASSRTVPVGLRDVIDLAVHAAAEASDASPRAVRAGVIAALRRVASAGVPLEVLAEVLAESSGTEA